MTRGCLAVTMVSLLLFGILTARSQEICFTNRIVTFTNLEGKVFNGVQLDRGDLDGVIWRSGVSGGRVSYTNLPPALLDAWGIPRSRIEVARQRAQAKAIANVKAREKSRLQALEELTAHKKEAAHESAEAVRQARQAQKSADADAIEMLAKQIEDAKLRLRRAKAAAHDFNQANHYNRLAPRVYVKDSERVKIEEAEKRLKRMKAEYAIHYQERIK